MRLFFEFLFNVLLKMIFIYQFDRFHNMLVILNLREKFSSISIDFTEIFLTN